MKKTNDQFGNRMKAYENQTCGIKMMPRIPVIARLDGRDSLNSLKVLKDHMMKDYLI